MTLITEESLLALLMVQAEGEVDHEYVDPAPAPVTVKVFIGLGSVTQRLGTVGVIEGRGRTVTLVQLAVELQPAASVTVTQYDCEVMAVNVGFGALALLSPVLGNQL